MDREQGTGHPSLGDFLQVDLLALVPKNKKLPPKSSTLTFLPPRLKVWAGFALAIFKLWDCFDII